MSRVPPALIEAYRAAVYEVTVAPGAVLRLRIGAQSPKLDRILRAQGIASAAFLTAYNPASFPLCEAENCAADENLARELEHRGLRHLRARGVDPGGQWPEEPGYLVLGISRDEAAALARAFDQNGVVYFALDAPAELVLIR